MTGPEPLLVSAVSGIAVPIFQLLLDSGKAAISQLGRTLDEGARRLIFRVSQQYTRNYTDRHGILKVLGMREPVSLESVYTTVQLLDEGTIRSFESIEALEELYRQSKSRGFQPRDHSKQAGIEVANKQQYLMVLGSPGAGKSTFLRKMGLEALKGRTGSFQHTCIPVFLELKQFASHQTDIEQLIAEEFRTCGFPSPDEFTATALSQGKLLLLLDGLDEVPTKNLNEAISKIQNFVDQHSKNRFIASCRTAAYHTGFRRFTDVTIAEFDGTQIEEFIHNWFQSELDKQAGIAQKCWDLLQEPENASAKELAQTPLLLTFLCLVYDHHQTLPNKRGPLYRKALNILLEEWAAEKRLERDEIYQGLTAELEIVLLSEIAYKGFEADQRFFSEQEIIHQIKVFLADTLDAPKHLNGKAVLDAIEIQQGILVERAEDVFSFSHLTLQEYLTARYIAQSPHRIDKLVTEHLTEDRWREVFLLVVGLIDSGDELLLLMEKEAQKYLSTPKLKNLLHWVDQMTAGSEANFKPAAKRAAAIALARNDLALTRVLDPDLASDLALAGILILDPALDPARRLLEQIKIFKEVNLAALIDSLMELKAQIPDKEQPVEVYQDFVDRLQQTCFNTFKLNSDLVDLSDEEKQSLTNYLAANLLMVRCQQAAVRVSRKTWEEIEGRMLLVMAAPSDSPTV